MRLAFVTPFDSSELRAWSGTVYHMLDALKKSGVDVVAVDKLSDPYRFIFRAKRVAKNIALRKNYLRDREPLSLKAYARQVEDRLKRLNPDIVFSPGTIPIAYLRTDKPLIFWTDATFDGMIDFYPEYRNLCGETLRNGHRMEQAALSSCRLAIYSSEWAAQTALSNYIVDSSKVKVVPFGANLSEAPSAATVERAIKSRNSGTCKLLFVGVDWYRKGGDMALAVASSLKEQGLNVELHVAGCDPPLPLPAFVKTHGFLSKGNRAQSERLALLYEMSDFFILPSEAECAAVVVAEANAFGLPALTTNVGGMRTVIRDDKNGRTFDSVSFVQECAAYILKTKASKECYRGLCVSSLEEYSSRLNWDSAVRALLNLLASEGIRLS